MFDPIVLWASGPESVVGQAIDTDRLGVAVEERENWPPHYAETLQHFSNSNWERWDMNSYRQDARRPRRAKKSMIRPSSTSTIATFSAGCTTWLIFGVGQAGSPNPPIQKNCAPYSTRYAPGPATLPGPSQTIQHDFTRTIRIVIADVKPVNVPNDLLPQTISTENCEDWGINHAGPPPLGYVGGIQPLKSLTYTASTIAICRRLLRQLERLGGLPGTPQRR